MYNLPFWCIAFAAASKLAVTRSRTLAENGIATVGDVAASGERACYRQDYRSVL